MWDIDIKRNSVIAILTCHPHTRNVCRYNKRHVALKLAYVGWDYHGFASQDALRTIEVITSMPRYTEQRVTKVAPCTASVRLYVVTVLGLMNTITQLLWYPVAGMMGIGSSLVLCGRIETRCRL